MVASQLEQEPCLRHGRGAIAPRKVLRLLVANGNRTFFERGMKILPSVSSSSLPPCTCSKRRHTNPLQPLSKQRGTLECLSFKKQNMTQWRAFLEVCTKTALIPSPAVRISQTPARGSGQPHSLVKMRRSPLFPRF